ncbi:hypothetical protein [uncultured Methanobrevibacter sp.]|uniref:hypothetical protein n=1 Tax=uncultured Methanobrevibacter sp. TaxID=253161 RepID=UPI0015B90556|nr:hypothetical protein [uncultured Methanobrevibacter sp.]
MKIDLKDDEILFLESPTGIIGIVKVAKENKIQFIATKDEEIVQALDKDDIIAVSSLKGNKQSIRSLAYLTREEDSPLVILDKNHPSTKRLSTVVSVGDRVNLNCDITPGTHPEQTVLCSTHELHDIEIKKTETGIELNRDAPYTIEKF